MDSHEFAHKIKPLWRALLDIERIGLDSHRDGQNRGLTVAQIARDVRSKFTAEEQKIVDDLVGRRNADTQSC